MKKVICDRCKCDTAQSYSYTQNGKATTVDLCLNCLQDFVLNTGIKLVLVNESVNENKRQLLQD